MKVVFKCPFSQICSLLNVISTQYRKYSSTSYFVSLIPSIENLLISTKVFIISRIKKLPRLFLRLLQW